MKCVLIIAILAILVVHDGNAFRRRRRRRSCSRVNGGWSDWAGWGACSCDHKFGTGTRTRTKTCTNPAPYCGGSACSGSASQTGRCDDQCCKITDGGWSAWVNASDCFCDYDKAIGEYKRRRTCTNPPPSCNGKPCTGAETDVARCDNECCKAIDGGWGSWSTWGQCHCNYSEGTGVNERQRKCTSPKPFCRGKPCQGPPKEYGKCDMRCCTAVHGGWTLWGSWGACVCYQDGSTTMKRQRSCTQPTPHCHGDNCTGKTTQIKNCSMDTECTPTVAPLIDPCPGGSKIEINGKCVHVAWFVIAGLGFVGIAAAIVAIVFASKIIRRSKVGNVMFFSRKITETATGIKLPPTVPPQPPKEVLPPSQAHLDSISLTSEDDGCYDNEPKLDLRLETEGTEDRTNHYERFDKQQPGSDHAYMNKENELDDTMDSMNTVSHAEDNTVNVNVPNVLDNENDLKSQADESELGYENKVFID